MAEMFLAELQGLVQNDIPPCKHVRDALIGLAEGVKAGGPSVREQVLSQGAYQAVTQAWSLLCYAGAPTSKLFTPEAGIIREASLTALYSLTAGFPEIIDETGWMMVQQAIDLRLPEPTQTQCMKVIRNICIKSEGNRERITWEMNLMEPLVLMIKRDRPSPEFVREWCGTMKTLILSDDPREAYNRAPERKRMIHQQQALPILSRHLQTYSEDEATLNALAILLGSMAVNEDMCISIESGNVFPSILKIFKSFPQNRMLIKNTLSLLRYLNVSPTVRDKCAGYGLVKWVLQLMIQHKVQKEVLEVGMSCLAFMTLRNACQAAQFLAAGGIPITLELMRQNSEDIPVLKGACLTLRNVAVSGSTSAKEKILEAGAEEILREVQERFPDLRLNHVKPALRDLAVLREDEMLSPSGNVMRSSMDTTNPANTEPSEQSANDNKSNSSD